MSENNGISYAPSKLKVLESNKLQILTRMSELKALVTSRLPERAEAKEIADILSSEIEWLAVHKMSESERFLYPLDARTVDLLVGSLAEGKPFHRPVLPDYSREIFWVPQQLLEMLQRLTEQQHAEEERKERSKLLQLIHPVGSIYMSVADVDPSTLFGGSWQRWGAGRVPVGVNPGEGEFCHVEQMGGEKSHVLSIPELPQTTYIDSPGGFDLWASKRRADCWLNNRGGGNQPHNNLQPYITCFMWKRVA